MKKIVIDATIAVFAATVSVVSFSGCAVENLTVHNFRTMGMDGDSASTAAAIIDAVVE